MRRSTLDVRTLIARHALASKLTAGLAVGIALGVVGLPRLELPTATLSSANVLVQVEPTSVPPLPTAAPVAPIPPVPTAAPVAAAPLAPPAPMPPQPRVLFAEPFQLTPAEWVNDAAGPAWFANGEYRLIARESSRFVAACVPLSESVHDAVLAAKFRKVGGPPGGGYGFVVRDQGTVAERDGVNQMGRYLVLEAGDRGDIGVWHREQTKWIDVVPWTRSDAVHLEREQNALTVTMRGPALRFEVNDQVVADLTYSGLPSTGNVGIFVGGDLNEVALEWLRIEAL